MKKVYRPHLEARKHRMRRRAGDVLLEMGRAVLLTGAIVAVTAGLKEGETVVSTGVFKLRNGQAVAVDNSLAPKFELAPTPKDR